MATGVASFSQAWSLHRHWVSKTPTCLSKTLASTVALYHFAVTLQASRGVGGKAVVLYHFAVTLALVGDC